MDEPKLVRAHRFVRLPPSDPIPPGHCYSCRKPYADHRECSRCGGDGRDMVKRFLDPEYPPCRFCDGSGTECPPRSKGGESEHA
jgi:hypothetical protein